MKKPPKLLKVLAREAFYIDKSQLSREEIEATYERETFQFFKDSACEKCEFFQDRPTDTCEECPNNLGLVKLSRTVVVNDRNFLTIPLGDKAGLRVLFGHRDLRVLPQWPVVPMKSQSLKFIGKLRGAQPAAVNDMLRVKRGVLRSPPRSGKTVMAASLVCQVKCKTIIIAAQRDWLVNFYETFVGSKTQKPLTNISTKRCGFAKTLDEFKRYDVALATYQTFISPKGQALLKKLRRMFTVLVVDECHRSASPEHAKVVAALSTRYRIGLSGTPQRKDSKHKVMHRIVGPILHTLKMERLVPRITFVDTKVSPTYQYKSWTAMINYLELNPQRLRLIAKMAIQDAKRGHMVLIPLARVTAIKVLVRTINKLAEDVLAVPFYGGVSKDERDKNIERARKYKIKIIVGNTKLLSTGINIPRASCIYQCTPSSNLPNAEQRFSRILTPFDGKPQPLIRVFADDMGVVKNCFRSEWWGVVNRLFKPEMTDDVKEKLYAWMNSGSKAKARQAYEGGEGFRSGRVL